METYASYVLQPVGNSKIICKPKATDGEMLQDDNSQLCIVDMCQLSVHKMSCASCS